MASIEELQEELVRQSSRRLEAEHDRLRLDELWRKSVKEIQLLETENATLKQSNADLTQKVTAMENELTDLSSSLLDEANQQVAEANRKTAAAHKLIEERDDVIAFQDAQLQALKEMLERNEEERSLDKRAYNSRLIQANSRVNSPRLSTASGPFSPNTAGADTLPDPSIDVPGPRIKLPALPGEFNRQLLLDLDSYASPLRPIMRTDLRDYKDFVLLWGIERNVHPSMFSKLEAPPWRRTKYVQMAIQEDIEPTLRLDKAPHLSWLSSRAFLNGVLEQTLAIQPVSQKERPWALRPSQPCLLCGETRGDDIYARSFWALPAPDADHIVLDLTCVVKTRLVCEFVAFLRTIAAKEPGDQADYVRAWRQCNSMREQLFWARTGGLYPDSEALASVQSSAKEDFDFTLEDSQVDVTAASAKRSITAVGESAVAMDASTPRNAANVDAANAANIDAANAEATATASAAKLNDTVHTNEQAPKDPTNKESEVASDETTEFKTSTNGQSASDNSVGHDRDLSDDDESSGGEMRFDTPPVGDTGPADTISPRQKVGAVISPPPVRNDAIEGSPSPSMPGGWPV